MSKEKWATFMEGPVDGVRGPDDVLKALRGDTFLLFQNLRELMGGEKPRIVEVRAALKDIKNPLAVPPFIWFQAAIEFPALRQPLHDTFMAARALLPPPQEHYFFMIDVSEAAQKPIHDRSIVRYMDVAASVAAMAKGPETPIYTVSNFAQPLLLPADGLGFIDAVACSQPVGGQNLKKAMDVLQKAHPTLMALVFDGRDADFLPAESIFGFDKLKKEIAK